MHTALDSLRVNHYSSFSLGNFFFLSVSSSIRKFEITVHDALLQSFSYICYGNGDEFLFRNLVRQVRYLQWEEIRCARRGGKETLSMPSILCKLCVPLEERG